MFIKLFEEDPNLQRQLIEANSEMDPESVIPTIEIDFGVWDTLDLSAKETVLEMTSRFCGNVFKAFLTDALNERRKIATARAGQGAIEYCLQELERRIREMSSLGQG